MLPQSALIAIDNHGYKEFLYHLNHGHADTLGVEICYKLHEPEYFYAGNKSDWSNEFIQEFSNKRFQEIKEDLIRSLDFTFVYNIIFSKEGVIVDFYECLGSNEDWTKWEKKTIFQTELLTGYKSRLKVLCVDNP